MKRENLTWAELWPLVGDGQCFYYQHLEPLRPFKYIDGFLHVFDNERRVFDPYWELINTVHDFKLVDDPSKPKPASKKLQQDLENYAIRIFGQLEVIEKQCDYAARKDCIKALVSMFELLRADILREIDERIRK